MKHIVLTFPTGIAVKAEVLASEHDLAADLLGRLEKTQELVCNHLVTAGKIFDAYMRPDKEPVAAPKGNHPVAYQKLASGDILWDGEKLSVVYGELNLPGTAGCVVAHVNPDAAFDKACKFVWYDLFREHTVTLITASKED